MSVDHYFLFAVFSDAVFVIFHTEPRKHGKQSLQLPVHYYQVQDYIGNAKHTQTEHYIRDNFDFIY